MIFIFLFRVEPCCAGLFSLSFSLRSLVLFLGEEKKWVFCFIPLFMHFIDNNYIVTDDAGSWWLVFVKAKMWFGSGRDYASMSSSSRSLNLLSVWFCPLILRSWFGVLTFDSNCIFACSFCFFSPTSSKDRWIKKIKKKKKKKRKKNCVHIENIFIFTSFSHPVYELISSIIKKQLWPNVS